MTKQTYANYDLEIDGVIDKIKRIKARTVLLQFPDGLKIHSGNIVDKIESQTDALCLIWGQTNFGACDLPQGLGPLKIDLVVAFGHNPFHKRIEGW